MKSLIQFIEFILLPVIGITSGNIGTNSQDLFNAFASIRFIVIFQRDIHSSRLALA
jgi:hypothetical protein